MLDAVTLSTVQMTVTCTFNKCNKETVYSSVSLLAPGVHQGTQEEFLTRLLELVETIFKVLHTVF
jgi:hypothetical protein